MFETEYRRFVGVGAVLGLLAPFIGAIGKIGATITASDVAYIGTFAASCMLAIVCLAIAGVLWFRNRGLAAKIRGRTKRPS